MTECRYISGHHARARYGVLAGNKVTSTRTHVCVLLDCRKFEAVMSFAGLSPIASRAHENGVLLCRVLPPPKKSALS